jgi:DNA invertase Pin-like site-specific DNA recombinase
MEQHLAVYVRVSSSSQSTRSQEPDLRRRAAAEAGDEPIRWYKDTAPGKTMDRPGWHALEAAMREGRVAKVLVWRIDRLGRTASGLTTLFEQLVEAGIGLVSLKDGLDLQTPAGRLMATVLAGVAAYEREVRGERQAAGIAAAKEAGKTWGGRAKGARWRVTPEIERQARRMARDGESKSAIARILGLARPTVYSILQGDTPLRPPSDTSSRG